MTWNSSCSITSDDENSRHSFMSDCGSEFDLKPQPRYPSEKRTYSTSNKQTINRIEPPMTRSRAKALGKTMTTFEQPLPKQRRQSVLRRSIDAFTGMATTLTNNLNNKLILFEKEESQTSPNDRLLNAPLDGVNILADRFESCSLDEGKLNKNCLWPSRETHSHYMRPITTSSPTTTFGANPFPILNNSPLFAQSSTSTLYGQQPVQLWSRFRYAASTLRNNLWIEQTNTNLQQIPSNIFTSNNNNNNNNPFNFTTQSSIVLPSQTTPTEKMIFHNKTSSTLNEDSSSSVFRQRNIPQTPDSIPLTSTKETVIIRQSSISKNFFTLTIFIIGLILGYILTNTLPASLVWEICMKYFHLFYVYLQNLL